MLNKIAYPYLTIKNTGMTGNAFGDALDNSHIACLWLTSDFVEASMKQAGT